jgi:hypothetical protein
MTIIEYTKYDDICKILENEMKSLVGKTLLVNLSHDLIPIPDNTDVLLEPRNLKKESMLDYDTVIIHAVPELGDYTPYTAYAKNLIYTKRKLAAPGESYKYLENTDAVISMYPLRDKDFIGKRYKEINNNVTEAQIVDKTLPKQYLYPKNLDEGLSRGGAHLVILNTKSKKYCQEFKGYAGLLYPTKQLYVVKSSEKIEDAIVHSTENKYNVDDWIALLFIVPWKDTKIESLRAKDIQSVNLTQHIWELFYKEAGKIIDYIGIKEIPSAVHPANNMIFSAAAGVGKTLNVRHLKERNNNGREIYLHTSTEELNRSVGPLTYGDVVTVCKRVDCGATRLMCNEVSLNLAKYLNDVVDYLSTEETGDEIREITKDKDNTFVIPTNISNMDLVLSFLNSFQAGILVIDSVVTVEEIAKLKSAAMKRNLLLFIVTQCDYKVVQAYSKATISLSRVEDKDDAIHIRVHHKDSYPDFNEVIKFDKASGYFTESKRELFDERVSNVLVSLSNRQLFRNKETFLQDMLYIIKHDDLERIADHGITVSEVDEILIKLRYLWFDDFSNKPVWHEVGEDLILAPSYKPNGQNRKELFKATSDLLWKEFNEKEI